MTDFTIPSDTVTFRSDLGLSVDARDAFREAAAERDLIAIYDLADKYGANNGQTRIVPA